jgi:hypothetical protein
MGISGSSVGHQPLTSPAYAARQRAEYLAQIRAYSAKRIATARQLKAADDPANSDFKALGNISPLPQMSALAIPMLNMQLRAAFQMSLEKSIYDIEVDL